MTFKKMSQGGTISIPVQLRREYGLHPGDAYGITVQDDGSVLLKPHTAHCVFCGGTENVTVMEGRGICAACVVKAKEALLNHAS